MPTPKQFYGHTDYRPDFEADDAVNEHPVFSDHGGLINDSTGEPISIKEDVVNSPKHYADAPIECIDAMVHCFGIEEVQTYSKIAAFKYLWRSQYKHDSDKEDLAKAEWYIKFANGNDPRSSK